jgi:anti-sigma factor RsiW
MNQHVLGELSPYLDGRLDKAARQRVAAHLKSCDACARHLEELTSLKALMKDTPQLVPPESFYQGVLRRIETAKQPKPFSWGLPLKALVSFCLVMLVVWVTREGRPLRVSNLAEMKPTESVSRRASGTEAAPRPMEAKEKPALPLAGLSSVGALKKDSAPEDALRQMADTAPPAQPPTIRAESAPAQDRLDSPGSLQSRSLGGTLSAKSLVAPASISTSASPAATANVGALSEAGVPSNWLKCESATDCVQVPEFAVCACPCNSFVNRRFEDEYRKANSGRCAAATQQPCNKICPSVYPVCTAGVCQAATVPPPAAH